MGVSWRSCTPTSPNCCRRWAWQASLPLLWTCDYIPKNPDDWEKGPYDRSCPDETTEYTVGEFNCSCVGISKFQAVCGGEQTLADVSDEDYFDACELTDLMGVKAIEMLDKAKAK